MINITYGCVFVIVVCALVYAILRFQRGRDQNSPNKGTLPRIIPGQGGSNATGGNVTIKGGTGITLQKDLSLTERLNLRYEFADVKINERLSIMTWKNFAGKKMQSTINLTSGDVWRRACTMVEDSLHDTRTVRRKRVVDTRLT